MRTRWHDREQAAALLAEIAALRLGGERAAAIDAKLQERARQLWRLAREPLALDDAPAWDADAVQEAVSGDLPEGFAAVRSGRPAAVEVFAACRDRIQRLDPTLHAWAALDLDTAERAAAAATAAGATAQRPLAGVPVGIKDVFATAGLPTRAGSALLADRLAATASDGPAGDGGDAPAVARLRQAGAVVVGKTACTELALHDPAPTRNPWEPTRTRAAPAPARRSRSPPACAWPASTPRPPATSCGRRPTTAWSASNPPTARSRARGWCRWPGVSTPSGCKPGGSKMLRCCGVLAGRPGVAGPDGWARRGPPRLGLPAISLPVGLGATGMPLAVQFIGALGADERLLAVARWCEQALNIDLQPPLA